MECVQATERGGDDEVSQQQQPANRGQPPRVHPRRRIHTPAVREMLADPDVIDADQTRDGADGQQVR